MERWAWIASAGAVTTAIIGALAKFADIPKIFRAGRKLFGRLFPPKQLKLRDAKKISAHIDGEMWPGRTTNDFEILIEFVASSAGDVKSCTAELDTNKRSEYYQALKHGEPATFDVKDGDNLIKCKFYISVGDIPTAAQIRIRSSSVISNWAQVDWRNI
jgi:hypothetical protein